jgi:hypothetical protein
MQKKRSIYRSKDRTDMLDFLQKEKMLICAENQPCQLQLLDENKQEARHADSKLRKT